VGNVAMAIIAGLLIRKNTRTTAQIFVATGRILEVVLTATPAFLGIMSVLFVTETT